MGTGVERSIGLKTWRTLRQLFQQGRASNLVAGIASFLICRETEEQGPSNWAAINMRCEECAVEVWQGPIAPTKVLPGCLSHTLPPARIQPKLL
jgi:hypothetical protein